MSAADWYAAPPLRTARLRLDALRLADAPDFLSALGSPAERAEVLAHLRYPPLTDLAGARQVVVAALTDPDRVPYAQRLADGTFVGTTSFYEIAPAVRAVAIGHTFNYRRDFTISAAEVTQQEDARTGALAGIAGVGHRTEAMRVLAPLGAGA